MLNKEKDRQLEVSSKLIEMGNALMTEGRADNDFVISQTGIFLILLGGVMFDVNDVEKFGDLCSMFSAKKILDSMENSNNPTISKLRKDDSYEDLIKRLNKLRGKDDSTPKE